MYNLSAHYENVYKFLQTIITDPTLIYLHPFGCTQPENIEIMRTKSKTPGWKIPVFIFHDQEPLNFKYNQPMLDHIRNTFENNPLILVSTESMSQDKNQICDHYGMAHLDYFFHIFAATDWFRGHWFDPLLVDPRSRQFKKTYITLNRLTGDERVYRSLLINSLHQQDLLSHGYVSYSSVCPLGGSYQHHLEQAVSNSLITQELANTAIDNLNKIGELRVDFEDSVIPNQSMVLGPMKELMESFVFLVTETCFWQNKTHLTEKIFKPIILKMPFILVGSPHNLKYLRSYGFKTFDTFWDESYDDIEDPIKRLEAVVKILKYISSLSVEQQKEMYLDMLHIIEHNYQLFNDPEFIKYQWNDLLGKLKDITQYYQYQQPYRFDPKTKQAIPLDPN